MRVSKSDCARTPSTYLPFHKLLLMLEPTRYEKRVQSCYLRSTSLMTVFLIEQGFADMMGALGSATNGKKKKASKVRCSYARVSHHELLTLPY